MNNQQRGYKAKAAGDGFEGIFKAMCNREGIVCVDFPDGCIKFNSPRGLRLVPTQMPFDYLICRNGRSACVDAKTTLDNAFSYTSVNRLQLKALSETGPHVPSGYVVWFRTTDMVVFFDYKLLQSLRPRTSLKPENGVMLGRVGDCKLELILNHEINPTYQPSLF